MDSMIRALDSNSWMADRDVSDIFLNFQLHCSVKPYIGVDVSSLFEDGKEDKPREKRLWYHWDRNLMGFKSSPYNFVKMALVVEEVVKGDCLDKSNIFQWEHVQLNLPGTSNYTPTKLCGSLNVERMGRFPAIF